MNPKSLIEAATPILIRHENKRLRVYPDSEGIPTIGIGFNLLRQDAPRLCAQCGADYEALKAGRAELTEEQCNFLFQQSMISTIEWLTSFFPDYTSFSQPRQIALLDMGFNLGYGRFLGFQHMIARIKADPPDWTGAAQEALSSRWASQVGERAHDDAAMLLDELQHVSEEQADGAKA